MYKLIILTSMAELGLKRFIAAIGNPDKIIVVDNLDALIKSSIDENTQLICFGTSVIVPEILLNKLVWPAYNIHSASPDYPGRDPHHFAIYFDAKIYGATLHLMLPKVDSGPIVDVELFNVENGSTPQSLLSQANEAAFRIIERYGPRLLERSPLPELDGIKWGKFKSKRADFLNFCQLNPLLNNDEIEKRIFAFGSPDYDNFSIVLNRRAYPIKTTYQDTKKFGHGFEEFTEDGFIEILSLLKSLNYRFIHYGEFSEDNHVIWRHDVDMSMHRAARIAEIEASAGIISTYFINPRSKFYNIFEPEIENLILRIKELGHEIGLHFDSSAYNIIEWENGNLLSALGREKTILESLTNFNVSCVSWHNPGQSNLLKFREYRLSGMINAYSDEISKKYSYCSDSNGYWRFQTMKEIIMSGKNKLHLLTHPEWWTPSPLPPSDRVDRAIMGRAIKLRSDYNKNLKDSGRKNIGYEL